MDINKILENINNNDHIKKIENLMDIVYDKLKENMEYMNIENIVDRGEDVIVDIRDLIRNNGSDYRKSINDLVNEIVKTSATQNIYKTSAELARQKEIIRDIASKECDSESQVYLDDVVGIIVTNMVTRYEENIICIETIKKLIAIDDMLDDIDYETIVKEIQKLL